MPNLEVVCVDLRVSEICYSKQVLPEEVEGLLVGGNFPGHLFVLFENEEPVWFGEYREEIE